MSQDDVIRLSLITILLVFLPVGFYYRIRSHTGEQLDRWQEGAFILFGVRLGAVPGFIASIAWLINPRWMAWSAIPLPPLLRYSGFLLIGCGMALIVWTFRRLGGNLTDTVVTRRDHTLVTTGPYRYVRHPFYLAGALAALGGSLVTANWFLLVAALVPLAFLFARTRIEEEKLIERFGDEYRNYMANTPRFIPRLKPSMDREEALALLNAKLDAYRKLTYAELAAKVGDAKIIEVSGPSGVAYQAEIVVIWDSEPDGALRVLGSIDDGSLRAAFRPVCNDLVVREGEG